MLKRLVTPTSNVAECVGFILRGAKRRRTVALANAKMINADAGIQARLQAVK